MVIVIYHRKACSISNIFIPDRQFCVSYLSNCMFFSYRKQENKSHRMQYSYQKLVFDDTQHITSTHLWIKTLLCLWMMLLDILTLTAQQFFFSRESWIRLVMCLIFKEQVDQERHLQLKTGTFVPFTKETDSEVHLRLQETWPATNDSLSTLQERRTQVPAPR